MGSLEGRMAGSGEALSEAAEYVVLLKELPPLER